MENLTIDDVANAFLSIAPQTPKKLQKLCYYAYAWYLAFYDEKLFEENFEAWVHGPVNPYLYQEYKRYGWNEIPKNLDKIPSPDLCAWAKNIYNSYGNFDGDTLERLTHQETPWRVARGDLRSWQSSNNIVQDSDIAEYYRTLMNK